MSIEKKVIVNSEHGIHTFTVEEWDMIEGCVKIIYDEEKYHDVHFELPAMSKEEFKALVESVNFVMGWDV